MPFFNNVGSSWGGMNPYDMNLDLGINYQRPSWLDSNKNYFDTPMSSAAIDAFTMKPSSGPNPGAGAGSTGSNLFGSLGSAFGKTAGSFGSSMSPLAGFNMAGTFAGMSAINELDQSKRREIDRYWYKLGDEESRRINARNYLGEGTLLDEGAGNLEDRRNNKGLRFNQFANAVQNNSDKFNVSLAGKLANSNAPYSMLNLNRPY
jgi:hypothetical protein